MIELTYGDYADQDDLDAAILRALDAKQGYTLRLTTAKGEEDITLVGTTGDSLSYRAYDEKAGEPTGPTVVIDSSAIHGIHVY